MKKHYHLRMIFQDRNQPAMNLETDKLESVSCTIQEWARTYAGVKMFTVSHTRDGSKDVFDHAGSYLFTIPDLTPKKTGV